VFAVFVEVDVVPVCCATAVMFTVPLLVGGTVSGAV